MLYCCVIWGVLVVENISHVFSLVSGGSGVQARLRGDGSSLLHMLLAQQFDWGCSIQDGLFHMLGALVWLLAGSLASSLPGISFSLDGLSSIRNLGQAFLQGTSFSFQSLHLEAPGSIGLRRATEKLWAPVTVVKKKSLWFSLLPMESDDSHVSGCCRLRDSE